MNSMVDERIFVVAMHVACLVIFFNVPLTRLQESSKSEATRISGPGASKYTQMNKERTKEMQFFLMRIHQQHIQLVVFSIVCS